MTRINATFIKSASDKSGFITGGKPIIAVVGKSNVGKSSLINLLAGQKKLARTSNTPGRTRLVNYFDFGDFILADLPGYGFALASKAEKEKWGKLMEDFFPNSEIAHALALVDIRHSPTADDSNMLSYFYAYATPFSIIATKSDKIGKTFIKPRIREVASALRVGEADVIACSSTDGRGKDDVFRLIARALMVDKE